ncbi:MAG: SDR family NAD(P)-dependent oxidoreductase [Bacteroidota bacterium]|nr:SDR family NAD(P)-dependent oxidoreductase [Bacteroidota bacterium]
MNKTIVVTGGTKGIGKSIIEHFAAQKFDIVTCSRDSEELRKLQKEIEAQHPQVKLTYFRADLSIKSNVADFVDFIKGHGSSIDILVNNAGIFVPGQIHQEDEGILEKIMESNLYSAYYLTRGLIGLIKGKKGHIFNICSTASITAYSNGGSYCISKFALLGFSKVLREEMKEFGVRVTSILPGATYTASWEGAGIPEERFMKAEDVAKIILATYLLSDNAVVEEILLRPLLGDI